MSLLATLAPVGIKLLKEYMEKGEVDKSTLMLSLSDVMGSLRDVGHEDIDLLGRDMVVFGECLESIAANHRAEAMTTKPASVYEVQPLRPPGKEKICVRNPEKMCDECLACCG